MSSPTVLGWGLYIPTCDLETTSTNEDSVYCNFTCTKSTVVNMETILIKYASQNFIKLEQVRCLSGPVFYLHNYRIYLCYITPILKS